MVLCLYVFWLGADADAAASKWYDESQALQREKYVLLTPFECDVPCIVTAVHHLVIARCRAFAWTLSAKWEAEQTRLLSRLEAAQVQGKAVQEEREKLRQDLKAAQRELAVRATAPYNTCCRCLRLCSR